MIAAGGSVAMTAFGKWPGLTGKHSAPPGAHSGLPYGGIVALTANLASAALLREGTPGIVTRALIGIELHRIAGSGSAA